MSALPVLIALLASSSVQNPPADLAHVYAYRMVDRPAFEAGYRQHLDWHARANDPLAWYGWRIVEGERLGAFVDGAFGAALTELEDRVDPAGDVADFRATAAPHAEAIGNERWERLPAASRWDGLEARRPGKSLQVHVFVAFDVQGFEAAITARPPEASWYRAAGQGPALYMLAAPSRNTTLKEGLADLGIADVLHPGLGRLIRSEIWQYVPELSLIP